MNPAHVLVVYAEPLVEGRRVALLGPEDPSLVEAVLSLGARLVYVYDPRPKVEGVRRGSDPRVTVAPLRAGDLGVREGAFDAVFVPDLSLLGDAEAALAYVRRLVGSNGVALVGSKNGEAGAPWTRSEEGGPSPSYTEFYDLCALQFAEVKMVGLAPFAAYAVAEFAPEREPSIAFDASLVSSPEPPEWYVAIASQRPDVALEAYEIVQLPREAVLASAEGPVTDSGELASAQSRLATAEQKCHEAEARAGEEALRAERAIGELRNQVEEVRKLRDKAARGAKEVEEERRARQQLESDLAAARKNPELAQLRERTLALEAELIEARTQLATPRAPQIDPRVREERDALANEVATLRHRLGERERELEASLTRAQALEDRLADQLAQATRDGEERASAERLAAELDALQATHEHDVATLETALRARGEELRLARVELSRRERMVRELVAQIEAGGMVLAPSAEPSSQLLDQLELARNELAALVEEIRKRDRALAEARTAFDTLRRDLEAERTKTEQLARDSARREAALQTASWRIAELEKLGDTGAPPRDAESPDDARVRMQGELDALRRALAQEHQRSSELERRLSATPHTEEAEIARIRERLREREALIAQLSAELASRRDASRG